MAVLVLENKRKRERIKCLKQSNLALKPIPGSVMVYQSDHAGNINGGDEIDAYIRTLETEIDALHKSRLSDTEVHVSKARLGWHA